MSKYSTFAVDRHIEEHENLVHWVVHRQWLGPLPYLDAVQAGRIGLWRALRHYDPERGYAFSTYAVPAIQRAVWRAVVESQPPAHISLSRSGWLAPPCSPLDPTEALDEVERLLVCDTLYDLVCELPCRLAYIVVARYGLTGDPPQPWRVIAEGLRVTRQRVQQLHAEAMLWLAHPAYSLKLRQLVGRNTTADYRAYHARLRAWQRAQRRKR
jgi:RNA polymerase sigma factor (sigma-70 family)